MTCHNILYDYLTMSIFEIVYRHSICSLSKYLSIYQLDSIHIYIKYTS